MSDFRKIFSGNRLFLRVFAGETISEFGSGLTYVALMQRFQELTGNTDAWVWVLVAKALPYLFFGTFCGHWTDRFDAKKLLLVAHIGRFVALLGLAFCHEMISFFALLMVTAYLDALHIPTYRSLCTRILDRKDLLAANGMQETVRSLAVITGIGSSGFLMGLFSSQASFLLNAATFLIAAFNLMLLRTAIGPAVPEQDEASPRASGFKLKELFGPVIIFPVTVALIFDLFMGLEVPMFFPMSVDKGWEGAVTTGYCYATASIGSMLTAFYLMRRESSPVRIPFLACLILAADALIVVSVASCKSSLLAIALSTGFGVSETLLRTYITTEIQQSLPPQMVGRVFAALGSIREPMKVGAYILSALMITQVGAISGLVYSGGFEIVLALLLASGLAVQGVRSTFNLRQHKNELQVSKERSRVTK